MSEYKSLVERVLQRKGMSLRIGGRFGWDIMRYRLIEQAAEIEHGVSFDLAVHFGRDPVHILSLLSDVFWRVPIDARIKLLDEALWRTGLHDEVPFLTPRLQLVFRVRNLMAHSVTFSDRPESVTLASVRNGKERTVILESQTMSWALEAADCCKIDLIRIEGRIGDIGTWGRLYGLNER